MRNVQSHFVILCVVLAVATCSLMAAPLSPPVWPADSAWNQVMVGSGVYVDPLYAVLGGDYYATPPTPEQTDLVGGLDHHGNGPYATGFWYRDADNIMFRMRVDNDPDQGLDGAKFVWTVFLNTDADSDVDWALSLDNKVDAQVELIPAVAGGPSTASPWNPVTLGGTPHTGVAPLSTWSRFVNATTISGSHFHDAGPVDDDYFVDLAFPLSWFLASTGLGASDSFGVAFATSADHININKDLPDYTGWSNPVPEPATMALLALGGLAVVRRRK